MASGGPPLHVMAGVLRDAGGRVLLAQRGGDDALAGLWEFPGGKCEPGEAPATALGRELAEELGVRVEAAEPLLRVPWRQPGRALLLDAWSVQRWSGDPVGREGQALRWVEADALPAIAMPPADRPIATALRMPRQMMVTAEPGADAAAFLRGIGRALAAGARLVQLRAKRLDAAALRPLAAAVLALARPCAARVLLNGDPALALELGLDGVHLPAAALPAARPLPAGLLCGASCHDAAELARAVAAGLDYAVLGPVAATATHPDAVPLGWDRVAALLEDVPLPVYLIGGLGPADLARARATGAYGIAAIRAWAAV